eukprot:Em0004g263a
MLGNLIQPGLELKVISLSSTSIVGIVEGQQFNWIRSAEGSFSQVIVDKGQLQLGVCTQMLADTGLAWGEQLVGSTSHTKVIRHAEKCGAHGTLLLGIGPLLASDVVRMIDCSSFQPRGLNPSSERWQANLGCWRNGGVFSTGVWLLLDNLEDPELRPLAQSLPATVLRSRADTCACVIRLNDHHRAASEEFFLCCYVVPPSSSPSYVVPSSSSSSSVVPSSSSPSYVVLPSSSPSHVVLKGKEKVQKDQLKVTQSLEKLQHSQRQEEVLQLDYADSSHSVQAHIARLREGINKLTYLTEEEKRVHETRKMLVENEDMLDTESNVECLYWTELLRVGKPLRPLAAKPDHKLEIEMKSLRNITLAFLLLINVMWIVLLYTLQFPELQYFNLPTKAFEVFYLAVYTLIVSVQFCALVIHRGITFIHYLANVGSTRDNIRTLLGCEQKQRA